MGCSFGWWGGISITKQCIFKTKQDKIGKWQKKNDINKKDSDGYFLTLNISESSSISSTIRNWKGNYGNEESERMLVIWVVNGGGVEDKLPSSGCGSSSHLLDFRNTQFTFNRRTGLTPVLEFFFGEKERESEEKRKRRC